MEIREIVEFYFNDTTNILQVTFRSNEDSEDYVKYDEILLQETIDFGYDLVDYQPKFIFEDEEYENDYNEPKTTDIDGDELLSFLNEYYVVYPNRIPESEIY